MTAQLQYFRGFNIKNNVLEWMFLLFFVVVYEFLCYKFILSKSPLNGDEHHFYRTSVSFANDLGIQRILQYDELTTPLTFISYGIWGKIFGTDLHMMRLLSLVIGGLTHVLFFYFLKLFFKSVLVWLFLMLWILNPYVIGFNAFIYTDGLSNLWIILFLIALRVKNSLLLFLSSVLLLYTRQYNVLILLAALISLQIMMIRHKQDYRNLQWSIFMGMVSIIPLFYAWQGSSPPGLMSNKLQEVPFKIYLESFPVYVYCMALYAFPAVIIAINRNRIIPKALLTILLLTLVFYIVFPVAPSYIAVKDGFNTVGLFDKALEHVIGLPLIKHAVLYSFFFLGSCIMYLFVMNFSDFKKKSSCFLHFSLYYTCIFLLMMIVNFQIWEKYFIQIFPVVLVMTGALMQSKASNPKIDELFPKI